MRIYHLYLIILDSYLNLLQEAAKNIRAFSLFTLKCFKVLSFDILHPKIKLTPLFTQQHVVNILQ